MFVFDLDLTHININMLFRDNDGVPGKQGTSKQYIHICIDRYIFSFRHSSRQIVVYVLVLSCSPYSLISRRLHETLYDALTT